MFIICVVVSKYSYSQEDSLKIPHLCFVEKMN